MVAPDILEPANDLAKQILDAQKAEELAKLQAQEGEARPGKKLTAEADLTLPADASERITLLSSLDYRIRQTATEQLLGDERITLPMIENALKTRTLSEEARTRLLQVGRQSFMKTTRGAMGVQFAGTLPQRVVVGITYKPFDSAEKLEVGDIIIEADGAPIRGPSGRTTLQTMIIAHDPGEVLPIVVRRGSKKIPMQLTLGQFDQLPNNQGAFLPEERMARAWKLRSSKLRLEALDASTIKLPSGAKWERESSAERQRNQFMARHAKEQPVQIVGGGVARQAMTFEPEQRFMQQFVIVNGRQQLINLPMAMQFREDAESMEPTVSPVEELDDLLKMRMQYAARLRAMPNPDDPRLSPSQAADAKAAVGPYVREIEVLDKQRQAIEAEVAETTEQSRQSAVGSHDPVSN